MEKVKPQETATLGQGTAILWQGTACCKYPPWHSPRQEIIAVEGGSMEVPRRHQAHK